MKRWLDVKLLLVMVSCTVFLIAFSTVGANAYEAVFKETTGYSEGTSISSIDISGLSAQEAMTKVLETIDTWKANSSFKVKIQDNIVQLDPAFLRVDIKGSLEAAIDGQSTPLLATVNIESLKEQIEKISPILSSSINYKKLTGEIQKNVSQLHEGSFEFDLLAFTDGNAQQTKIELAKSVTIGYDQSIESFINEWVKEISPITVDALQSYSLLSAVKGDRISDQRLEALNVISSGLYEAALLAGFDINQRHRSSMLPSYSKLGFEAAVKPAKMNLIFTNPNSSIRTINLTVENARLVISVEGYPSDYKYELVLENEQSLPPKTIIQPTATLQSRTTKTVKQGKEGKSVFVYRNKIDKTGEIIESRLISEDYYPPEHEIVQVPLKLDQETIDKIVAEQIALKQLIEDAQQNGAVHPPANIEVTNDVKESEKIWGDSQEIQKDG